MSQRRSSRKNRRRRIDPRVIDALSHLLILHKHLHTNDRRNTPEGHWINEAFVIRLCAVLEAHRVLRRGDQLGDTHAEGKWLDLCKRVRNLLAHTTGDVVGEEAMNLDRELRAHAGIGDIASVIPGKFTLPKNKVLYPMHAAAVAYSRSLISAENAA